MEDSKNDDAIGVDTIKDRVWELTDKSLANVPVNRGVHFGHRRDPVEDRLHSLRNLVPSPDCCCSYQSIAASNSALAFCRRKTGTLIFESG